MLQSDTSLLAAAAAAWLFSISAESTCRQFTSQ